MASFIAIFYNSKWSTTFCHNQTDGGSWTETPGFATVTSPIAQYEGWQFVALEGRTAALAFNNGEGVWDNNHEHPGVYAVDGGSVTRLDQVASTEGTTPVTAMVYKTAWRPAYIHFSVNGGEWTTLPGQQAVEAPAHFKTHPSAEWVLALLPGTTGTFALTNGAGEWDSQHGANYTFGSAGVYELIDGVLRSSENDRKRKHNVDQDSVEEAEESACKRTNNETENTSESVEEKPVATESTPAVVSVTVVEPVAASVADLSETASSTTPAPTPVVTPKATPVKSSKGTPTVTPKGSATLNDENAPTNVQYAWV